jgi:hypothetical protein
MAFLLTLPFLLTTRFSKFLRLPLGKWDGVIQLNCDFLSINFILELSAYRNGQIKLFGRDNTQALLQSENVAPTMLMQVC